VDGRGLDVPGASVYGLPPEKLLFYGQGIAKTFYE